MQTLSLTQTNRWRAALLQAPTTGASAQTASQDNLAAGVSASQQMAKTDLPRVVEIANRCRQVGTKFNLPPAMIAALASRESRCGAALDAQGNGDGGNAFGILQVDRRFHHPLAGVGDPTSVAHIEQAVGIFIDFLQQVQDKHPDWEDALILKGAVAAYNSGVDNIVTQEGMDRGTTGDDYSSDVIARAQFYVSHL